jgi:hypothetical protein
MDLDIDAVAWNTSPASEIHTLDHVLSSWLVVTSS